MLSPAMGLIVDQRRHRARRHRVIVTALLFLQHMASKFEPVAPELARTLDLGGYRWKAVASADEAAESEPPGGWAGAIIDCSNDVTGASAFARTIRKREPDNPPVLALVLPPVAPVVPPPPPPPPQEIKRNATKKTKTGIHAVTLLGLTHSIENPFHVWRDF